jgi:hypothetical protein
MALRKQFRKREASSSSSDSEEHNNITALSSNTSKKSVAPTLKPKSTLSFGDDENEGFDEGGDNSAFKKSKPNKSAKKKMRQAPPPVSMLDQTNIAEVASTGARDYSMESLDELRKSQRFSVHNSETAVIGIPDTIELNGDDAVAARDDDENVTVPHEHNHHDVLGRYNKDTGVEIDSKSRHRLNMLAAKDATPDFNVVDDIDSARWEQELIKRAGAKHPVSLSEKLDTTSAKASIDQDLGRKHDEISLTDCRQSVKRGISSLEEKKSEIEFKTSELELWLENQGLEEVKIKKAIEKIGQDHYWIKDFRDYCADFVSCLREKESLISELSGAILKTFSEYQNLKILKQIERQEKSLKIIRKVQHY